MKLHQIALTITISVLSALSTQTVASNTAHSEIQVVGLFKDAAIISMHHQQQMMRVGDEKHDVRLLAANSQNALVEYHGKRFDTCRMLNFSKGGVYLQCEDKQLKSMLPDGYFAEYERHEAVLEIVPEGLKARVNIVYFRHQGLGARARRPA